jgi:hypothetical protein
VSDDNQHITNLIHLRVGLIKERRDCVLEGRAERLPELMAQIEAVDNSIIDERKLGELSSDQEHSATSFPPYHAAKL